MSTSTRVSHSLSLLRRLWGQRSPWSRALLAVASLGAVARGAALVENGQGRAVIIVSSEAPHSVQYAATELQAYIRKATGAELPIADEPDVDAPPRTVVYVGRSPGTKDLDIATDKLGYDGFRIRSGKGWVALVGRDYAGKKLAGTRHPFRLAQSYCRKLKINRYGETGTLYAVYHCLERFAGVRWYMPGELGEVVPKQSTFTVPEDLDITRVPDFEYRFLYDCDFPADPDSVRWCRRAGYGGPFPVNINHSFTLLRPLKDEAPECFALINGQRDFNITCAGAGSLCLSEPRTKDEFVRLAREFFDRKPAQFIFPVMPNDGYTRACECSRCVPQIQSERGRTGKFSNYVWHFVNDVAVEVYKTHPDKFIGCCAYSTYREAPDQLPRLSPNVVVMLCKTRRLYVDPEREREINATIDAWQVKLKPGSMYVWEYYCWPMTAPYLRNVPIVFPHIIARDLNYLRGRTRGEFIEAETWKRGEVRKQHFPGLTHINNYTNAKLLWDADTDVDALLTEYYAAFYGPARKEMQAFWALAEELWSQTGSYGAMELYEHVYTEQNVDHLFSLLDQAAARTAAASIERQRIDLVRSEFKPLVDRVRSSRLTKKPVYRCTRAVVQPRLDGLLDDACWQGSTPLTFVTKNGEPPTHHAKGYVAYDSSALYVAVACHEEDAGKLRMASRQRDANIKPYIWEDDSIEIFIDPAPDSEDSYFQFIVNAAGTIWDGIYGDEAFEGRRNDWNSAIEAAAAVASDGWTLEARIPLADLRIPRGVPPVMTANFIRNRRCGGPLDITCWSPTLSARNQEPTRFGTLQFSDADAAAGPERAAKPEFEAAYAVLKRVRAGRVGAHCVSGLKAAATLDRARKAMSGPAKTLTCSVLAAYATYLAGDLPGACKRLEIIKADEQFRDLAAMNKLATWQPGATLTEAETKLTKLLSAIPAREAKCATLRARPGASGHAVWDYRGGSEEQRRFTPGALAVLLKRTAPSFSLCSKMAEQALCVTNLRRMGLVLRLYAAAHDGKLPPRVRDHVTWHNPVLAWHDQAKWKTRPDVWRCPAAPEGGYSYGINIGIIPYGGEPARIPLPEQMLLVADSIHYLPGNYPHKPYYGGAAYQIHAPLEHSGTGTPHRSRHLGGANVLFADGQVEWFPSDALSTSSQSPFWKGRE